MSPHWHIIGMQGLPSCTQKWFFGHLVGIKIPFCRLFLHDSSLLLCVLLDWWPPVQAHPALAELERRKLCKLMDCQKLSQEACTHAAQNERLPVQVVVQVLYFEQLRMRNAMAAAGASAGYGDRGILYSQRISGNLSAAHSPKDSYASIRRENRELKLEVARMRMRLTDLEKDHASMKQVMLEKPTKPTIISSVSRKFSRLNPFARRDSKEDASEDRALQTPNSRTRVFGRRRRHSIS